MKYEEFVEHATQHDAQNLAEKPSGWDKTCYVKSPVPVKVDPAIPDPSPFEKDRVYHVRMFYPPDGKYPNTVHVGSPGRWWNMELFVPA